MSSLSSAYLVPPTQVDFDNAYMYAQNKVMKEVCDLPKFKGIFEWKEDPIVPYPCPFGLTCNSGKCVFTEKGCMSYSSMPFFECKRRPVECYLPGSKTGPDGKCYICDYQINDSKVTDGPVVPDEEVHKLGCSPGDQKYLRMTDPTIDDADKTIAYRCQGLTFDPEPYPMRMLTPVKGHSNCSDACKAYKLNDEPNCVGDAEHPDPDKDGNCTCTCTVACANDDECTAYGAGGACMLYEYVFDQNTREYSKTQKTKAYKKCVDTGGPYLEYRSNFSLWDNVKGEDMCVQTIPEFRKWCEMPWMRPASSPDDPHMDVWNRIKLHPQVKRHPPFYYDQYTGHCLMTKKYCTSSVPDGGFNTNFGEVQEYVDGIFTGCKNPGHNSAEVREGYDCCIPLGMSIASFFTGRSFLVSLQNVVSGEISFAEFWKEFGGPLTPIVDGWLSEDSLKMNVQLVEKDMIAPGVSLYQFEWHPDVRILYPDVVFPEGVRYGLLASEIERVIPALVGRTRWGHRKVNVSEAAWNANPTYRKIMKALVFTELASHPIN